VPNLPPSIDPVADWAARRRFRAEQFSAELLATRKRGTSVAVVIPTKECTETIGRVLGDAVEPIAKHGLLDEVVVIDAASGDGTAELAAAQGARVVQQDEVLTAYGPALGKGDALWRAVHETTDDVVCFIDGDTSNPDPRHVLGLIGPLIAEPSIDLVKGTYDRPLLAGETEFANEGGRVTELMARPLLNLYEPLLAGFGQPLAGEFAARRALLESIPFPVGYGVEIGTLIDALRAGGLDSLAEAHLGTRRNRHQPLRSLGEMSYAVLVAVERRRGARAFPSAGRYLRPWDHFSVAHVPVTERPPLRSLPLQPARPLPEAVAGD